MKAINLSQSQLNSSGKKHLPKLDVLRGIAILSVFLIHFLWAVFDTDHLKWNGVWLDLHGVNNNLFYWFYPFTFGWIGVPLFFVLSGFVIHLSYLNTTKFTISSFYWRRFWRIYPPYLLSLLFFIFFLNLHIFSNKSDFFEVLSHVLVIHNLHEISFFGINSSYWSLANEMQFYLLYPLLLIFRQKVSIKKTLLFTILLSLALSIAAAFHTNWDFDPNKFIWWSTPITLFDWVLGVYVAEQYFLGKRAFSLSYAAIFSLVLVFFLFSFYKPTWVVSFSLASFIWAMLLERYLHSEHKISRIEAIFIPLGLCSYSFYLWHLPLLRPIINVLHTYFKIPDSELIDMTVCMAISFVFLLGISWISYI